MSRKAWKMHDFVLMVAAAAVFLTMIIHGSTKDLDPEDFMVINKVYIPDHSPWVDTEIVYDRTVRQDFEAEWVVKIKRVGEQESSCTGEGAGVYTAGEKVEGKTLEWYVGKRCVLDPDRYLAITQWRLENGVIIDNTSNVFTVTDGGRPSLNYYDNR